MELLQPPDFDKNRLNNIIIQGLLTALIVLFCFGIFVFFVYQSEVNLPIVISFDDMLTGEGRRPYVTRVLVPWLTRGIAVLSPTSLHLVVETLIESNGIIGWLLREYWTPANYALEAMISLGLQLISLLGFAFTIRSLLNEVFIFPRHFVEIYSLVALVGLFPMLFFGYIYDFTSLFLSTLGIYLIVLQKKYGFLLVLMLAAINKETAIILIVPAILLWWDWPLPSLRKIILGSLANLFAYLLIRSPITWLFWHNPGSIVEYRLPDHLKIFENYPVVTILSIALIGSLIWLSFRNWRNKPAIIILGLLPSFGLLVLWLFYGYPFEVRIFYEVYAVLFIAMNFPILSFKRSNGFTMPTMQKWVNTIPAMINRNTQTILKHPDFTGSAGKPESTEW